MSNPLNIYVDIDNTIAQTPDGDYEQAKPITENIQKINELYERGHHINYWTGRGTITKIDWLPLTKKQLDSWGCKYHSVQLGKPAFDLFIDDKAINSLRYFDLSREEVSSIIKKVV